MCMTKKSKENKTKKAVKRVATLALLIGIFTCGINAGSWIHDVATGQHTIRTAGNVEIGDISMKAQTLESSPYRDLNTLGVNGVPNATEWEQIMNAGVYAGEEVRTDDSVKIADKANFDHVYVVAYNVTDDGFEYQHSNEAKTDSATVRTYYTVTDEEGDQTYDSVYVAIGTDKTMTTDELKQAAQQYLDEAK